MKRYYKYLAIIALVMFVVAGCIELLNFTHPDSAPINTQIDVEMELKLVVDKDNGDFTAPLVVSVLMPTSWNKSLISVTYSSDNLSGGPFVNEPMRATTASDKYRSLNSQPGPGDWNSETLKKLGRLGNYQPMQWVTFIGTQKHDFKGDMEYTGTIKIKLTTGTENIKTNLAYVVCEDKDGYSDKYYVLKEKIFETTGGDNVLIDYTIPTVCSVGPDSFTWEDIVVINYDATLKIRDNDQPLKGKDEVYLMATATYDNGAGVPVKVIIDEISSKTLMKVKSRDKWFLYLYPHEYFNIPAGKSITAISCYFVDATGGIEMRPGDESSEFVLVEKCE